MQDARAAGCRRGHTAWTIQESWNLRSFLGLKIRLGVAARGDHSLRFNQERSPRARGQPRPTARKGRWRERGTAPRERPHCRLGPASGSAVPPPGAAPPAPPGLRWRPACSPRPGERRAQPPGNLCAGPGPPSGKAAPPWPKGTGEDPALSLPQTSSLAQRPTWMTPKGMFYHPTPPDSR